MALLQALGKVVSLAGGIWAARCLGPEKLGISGVVFVLLPAFYLLSGWRLEVPLVRMADDLDRRKELEQTADTYATFQAVNIIALFAFALIIVLTAGLPAEGRLTLLLALPVLLLAHTQPQWLLQARERMPDFYLGNTLLAFVNTALIFLLIRPGSPAGTDLLAYLGGLLAAWLLMWRRALPGKRSLPRLMFAWLPRLWALAWRNKPIFLTGILMYVCNALEAPLVGWLYSIEELGRYRMALLFAASLGTFLQIIPLLLYPRLVAWQRESPQLRQHMQDRIALLCLGGGLPLVLAAFLLAPWLFPWLLGEAFAGAALPFALLFAGRILLLISSIYTWGFWASDDSLRPLSIIGPAAILSLAANLLLIPHYGMMAAAGVYLATETLILAGVWAMHYREKKRSRHPP